MFPAFPVTTGNRRRIVAVAWATTLGGIAHDATAQTIQGTATYREGIALPPSAVLEVTLEDVSRADAPADTIARTRVAAPGNPPIAFAIAYDAARIRTDRRYVVRGRILVDGRLRLTTDTAAPVLTRGSPSRVSLVLRSPGAGQPAPAASGPLTGSWQLVTFQGGDGTTLRPDDRTKYTLTFGTGGQLTARVDCNRGGGTWKAGGPNQLQLGPLALTRAQCPAGSLHDHIVKQWSYIRSYVIKDGHLYLALMADGGIYEFEPMTNNAGDRPRILDVSSVAPEKSTQLSSLIADIRRQADAFVFLSGGASRMREDHQRQLLAMFDALALAAAAGRRIAVGDGGTQAGIMEAAGRARRASGNAFPLLGVAPAAEIPPRGTTPVDPNHSHVVAVDNPAAPAKDSWGSETATMYWLFAALADGRPSVTVVANGGEITLDEVEWNVRAGRRMILIEGSGRAADALVSLLRKTPVSDPELVSLRERAQKATLMRRPELFTVVPLPGGATGLRNAITASLGGAR
jgi:uncharacterized lipoprotein YbaY